MKRTVGLATRALNPPRLPLPFACFPVAALKRR